MKIGYKTSALLGALILTGCGSDGDGNIVSIADIEGQFNQATSSEVTLTNAQALETNIINAQSTGNIGLRSASIDGVMKHTTFALSAIKMMKKMQMSKVQKSPSYAPLTVSDSRSCAVSGTESITLTGDTNNEYADYTKLTYNQCNDGITTTNGTSELTVKGNGVDITELTLTYATDFSVLGSGFDTVTSAGSTIFVDQIQNISEAFRVKQNYIIQSDGTRYGSKDLIYYFNINGGSVSFYPVSGREYINNVSNYFDVDSTYDASITPFQISFGTLQAGGLFKYLGAQAKKIEIEASNTNEITVRADVNGDSIFDLNTETSIHSL